jgi:hypothetical protein
MFYEKILYSKNIDEWIGNRKQFSHEVGLKIMVYYNYRKQAKGIIALLYNDDDTFKKKRRQL